jgi:hypothetical protein
MHACARQRFRAADDVPQLALRQNNLPVVQDLWFRYDPPTLIIAITWYQTKPKFGGFLHDRLAFSYSGSEESVRPLGSDGVACG